MKRLLTLTAGVCVALALNGCCLHRGGCGGGYGGCNTGCGYAPQPSYGGGFAPSYGGGGCPDGSCGAGYGPVSMSPIPAATAYNAVPSYSNGATVQAGVPATSYTATAPQYPGNTYPATAAIDPLPTF